MVLRVRAGTALLLTSLLRILDGDGAVENDTLRTPSVHM